MVDLFRIEACVRECVAMFAIRVLGALFNRLVQLLGKVFVEAQACANVYITDHLGRI